MFEHRKEPLLDTRRFLWRLFLSVMAGGALIVLSLLGGMLGYHYFESMPWIDAFANAAMILSGMGPLGPLQSTAGKLFAGLYALYSGLALILITGIVFAPLVHRLLHRFNIEKATRDR
jgi:hypothetical protein